MRGAKRGADREAERGAERRRGKRPPFCKHVLWISVYDLANRLGIKLWQSTCSLHPKRHSLFHVCKQIMPVIPVSSWLRLLPASTNKALSHSHTHIHIIIICNGTKYAISQKTETFSNGISFWCVSEVCCRNIFSGQFANSEFIIVINIISYQQRQLRIEKREKKNISNVLECLKTATIFKFKQRVNFNIERKRKLKGVRQSVKLWLHQPVVSI